MKQSSLEPGLLPLFRLFSAVRLGFLVLGYGSRLLIHDLPQRQNGALFWFTLANTTLLLVYLSVPSLQRFLRSLYLPVGLVIATIGPLIELNLLLRMQNQLGLAMPLIGAWQLLPLLFVPLVLIAWQYNFRSVVLFSLATAILDWGLSVSTVEMPSIYLFPLGSAIFTRTISFILVGYMVVRLMKKQREQHQALAQANTQLAHYAATLEQLTISRERNRLARELHDTLAHSLSGVAVQLEAVKTLWNTHPDEALGMLEQSLAATRNGLTETRRALQALRASPLEDLGLVLSIRGLAESVAARSGWALELKVPERLENLSPDVEQFIYRVTQEALENAARHAQAQHVKVNLFQIDHHLELTISDDGHGFELGDVDFARQFGLQGMRERSAMLGGELDVISRPGQGTTVRLTWGGKG